MNRTGYTGYDVENIKNHLSDPLSLILFEGHAAYAETPDAEILGKAVRQYFEYTGEHTGEHTGECTGERAGEYTGERTALDENRIDALCRQVRDDSPELVARMLEAMKAGYPDSARILSPDAARFYRGLGCIPEPFTDIYSCYFDSGIIRFGQDEVFVDGGAQDLFTSYRFSKKTRNKYKAIYAFEPDEKNYYECAGNKALFDERLHISAIALSDSALPVGFTENRENSHVDAESKLLVRAATLDRCLEELRPTYIKLHLEGAEYAALLGAEKLIRSCSPRLAVCVDHCREDIFRIPELILSYDSSYQLYLRHYSDAATETVLYAVKP